MVRFIIIIIIIIIMLQLLSSFQSSGHAVHIMMLWILTTRWGVGLITDKIEKEKKDKQIGRCGWLIEV